MADVFQTLMLGAVQGITEFLPISSTGHLLLVEKLFGISQDKFGLAFDASLHLGTLVAVLWFFKKDWLQLIVAIYRKVTAKTDMDKEISKLLKLIIIATIPGAVFGVLLEKKIETIFRSPILVAGALIIFSLVLLYIEKTSKKNKKIKSMSLKDGIFIGFAQAIALIPGVSRSGITIAVGMWEELTREEAARFTFLISVPIIAGAGGKKLLEAGLVFIKGEMAVGEISLYFIGILTSAFFGYLTIKYFLKYISKNSLMPFIIYRLLLGGVILGFFWWR